MRLTSFLKCGSLLVSEGGMQWDIMSKSLQMSTEPVWIFVVKLNASLSRKYAHVFFSV